MKTKPAVRCIIFVRGPLDGVNSIDCQARMLGEVAHRNHLTVVDTVRLENVSANSGDTASALERLLNRKRHDDDFETLLTSSVSCLTRRGLRHGAEVVRQFEQAGIDIVTPVDASRSHHIISAAVNYALLERLARDLQ